MKHLRHLDIIAKNDAAKIRTAEKDYDSSWKKRGGVGAFMMLARKWDRLENAVKQNGYDIFKAVSDDHRLEGVADDLRDLRQYLILVECELREQEQIPLVEPIDVEFESGDDSSGDIGDDYRETILPKDEPF